MGQPRLGWLRASEGEGWVGHPPGVIGEGETEPILLF
jgi:hypothetical protein